MTPAAAIAMVDRWLARTGETVALRRYGADPGVPEVEIAGIRAFVRSVRADELIAGVDQTGFSIVLSPTGLAAILPMAKGDKIVIAGRERNIEQPRPIRMADTLVRIDVLASG